MGNTISTGSLGGAKMHEISEVDTQSALPLSTKAPEIFVELSNVPFFQDANMKGFLNKIYIAENAIFVSNSGMGCMARLNLNPQVLSANLKAIKQVFLDIASLKTGQPLLKELNRLLGNNYYLVISFSLESGASPEKKGALFSIRTKQDKASMWDSVAICFPEKYEDFYELQFYRQKNTCIVKLREPTFLIVIHELIHGIQMLNGEIEKRPDDQIIKEDLKKSYPEEKLFENSNFISFWGGMGNWSQEFQAMVTGITCSDGIRVSESLAIQEFLSSDLVNEARFQYLEKFKGEILIPFGHNKECVSTPEYISFLGRCCEMLPRLGGAAILAAPATSLGTVSQMISQNTPPSGFDTAEIATMKREEEELQRSESNLRIIESQIKDQGYRIKDVRGDGNCGFYAILQCLHPDKNYEHVTQRDENWMATERLRREIFPTGSNLSQMVTNWPDPLQNNRFLPLDLGVLSAITRAQGRPIIVINSTYVEHAAFEDPTNHMFITVSPDGGRIFPINFGNALRSAGERPIVLLYTPNHWEAVILTPSTESSDKSSD